MTWNKYNNNGTMGMRFCFGTLPFNYGERRCLCQAHSFWEDKPSWKKTDPAPLINQSNYTFDVPFIRSIGQKDICRESDPPSLLAVARGWVPGQGHYSRFEMITISLGLNCFGRNLHQCINDLPPAYCAIQTQSGKQKSWRPSVTLPTTLSTTPGYGNWA